MERWGVFLLRVILSMAFSVILTRMFYPDKPLVFIAGIGVMLLALAYVFEYFRTGRQENQGD